jgi:hypothetical protein
MTPRFAVVSLGLVSLLLMVLSAPADAQWSPWGGRSGGGGAAFTGGTVTTAIDFSGIVTDITTPSNQDLTVTPNGTGDVVLDGEGVRINQATAGDTGLIITGTNADPGVPAFQSCGSGHACGRIVGEASRAASLLLSAGSANATGGNLLFSWADATDDRETWAIRQTATALTFVNIDEDSGSANGTYFQVTEYGTIRAGVGTALTITGADTDDPTPAGTACRISAGGAASWIPAETTAVDGQRHCCTNTSVNNITMTDSSGAYEGKGTILGQWDSVCFEYVTDRWVETATANN